MNRISTWILVAVMGLACVDNVMAQCSATANSVLPGPYCACGADLVVQITKKRVCGDTAHAISTANSFPIPRTGVGGSVPAIPDLTTLVIGTCNVTACPACGATVAVDGGGSVSLVNDPAVCGTCLTACTPGSSGGSGTASIHEKWRLGKGGSGQLVGYLDLHIDTMSPAASTPSSLVVNGGASEIEEVRDMDNGNCLRQVLSPECLVDIVTNSPFKYTMNYYRVKDVLSEPDTNTGYYVVSSQAQAFVSISVENPANSTNACDELWVVSKRGNYAVTNFWQYATVEGNQDWVLLEGGLRSETLERTSNGLARIDVRTVRDKDGVVASKVRETFRQSRFGYTLIEKVNDPDGAALTETTTLYENVNEPGRYGRIAQTVGADGSWIRYDYNTNGFKTVMIKPWLNAKTNATEAESYASMYAYDSVDSRDLGELVGYKSKPRMVTEKIAGKVTAKTYHAYYENDGGERVEVEERCMDPSAAYGAVSNLRTVKIYTPKSEQEWDRYKADKIKSITYPDGRLENTYYERGSYVANADPAQCEFEANATGDFVRVSVVQGTVASVNGVAMKSTKDVTIKTSLGYVVMKESYVYTGSGYERVAWTVNTLDEDGHTVLARNSDGTQVNTSWACCGKDSETDGQGMVHNYTYDALKRVISEEKEGITAGEYPEQENHFTEYTYDAAGRKLTQTIHAGSLSLVTSNQYDLTGRLVASIDPAGITTLYGQEGLTSTTIRGGVTNVAVRCLDGSPRYTLENGAVKSSYDYGVNGDGTRWTKIYTGPQGTNSLAWSKTTTDLLGRMISEEKPGFGGTVLTNAYVYNAKGQLIRTTNNQQPATFYE